MMKRGALAICLTLVGGCSQTLYLDRGGDGPATAVDMNSGVGNGPAVLSIIVTPDNQTLDITNGDVSNATVSYNALGTFDDGTMMTITDCTWTLQNVSLGTIKKSTFNASGDAGGTGKVICTYQGISGAATVNINLHDTTNSANLDDPTRAMLANPSSADPDVVGFLYPYDGTVFPRGLTAPELTWSGGSASDVYALTITEPGMDYTLYFQGSSPQRQPIPSAEWTKLEQTTAGGKATVTLSRLKGGLGGAPYKSVINHWTLSTANLRGTIYYLHTSSTDFSPAGLSVQKIKPNTETQTGENFLMPTPSGRCIGCHSVSKDGSTIAVSFDGTESSWGTFNAQTGGSIFDSTSGQVHGSGQNSGFQAISPDGSLVVWGQSNPINAGVLRLANAKTGVSLEPSGLSGNLSAYPSFSPDGKKLAFATRVNTADSPAFFVMRNTGLAVQDFDPITNQFSNRVDIKTPTNKQANVYPSFTPDGQWIIYQNGEWSSARPDSGFGALTTQSDLRMIKIDGTGDVALGNLSSGVAAIDLHRNYEPTLNPVPGGGYFWVVFVSMRQYGNLLTNTIDATQEECTDPSRNSPYYQYAGVRSKQLWVAAIDGNPQPGKDPSHPAFWLPGQDITSQNMRGNWALDPCKMLGEGCEAGFECCTGACRDSGDAEISMPKTCVMPQPGECAKEGDVCAASSDCCSGEICFAGTCSVVPN